MKTNWEKVIKTYLKDIPRNDYPVLDSFLFVSCWLNFVLDSSIESMRHLFEQLNHQGIITHYSNFSKAIQRRNPDVFEKILNQLIQNYRQKRKANVLSLFPLDSTIITVTSKLLHLQDIHQVKLFSGIDLLTSGLDGVLIHFGQGHDNKYGDETINSTPENAVGIMDRGFADLKRIRELIQQERQFFVMIIKKNWSVKGETSEDIVGKNERETQVRCVMFCDLEKRCEYRLVTNLPATGERAVSNEEIGKIYQQRWAIEVLWKFLKMHLKLDKFITKNVNGIRIQIYTCLIAYLLLGLIKIPK